jgi:hypothetical protein
VALPDAFSLDISPSSFENSYILNMSNKFDNYNVFDVESFPGVLIHCPVAIPFLVLIRNLLKSDQISNFKASPSYSPLCIL